MNLLFQVLMAPDFISNVVHFDPEKMTNKVRSQIKTEFFSQKEFTFENVDKASKACGPLCE
jgi:dynein heavy chain 1